MTFYVLSCLAQGLKLPSLTLDFFLSSSLYLLMLRLEMYTTISGYCLWNHKTCLPVSELYNLASPHKRHRNLVFCLQAVSLAWAGSVLCACTYKSYAPCDSMLVSLRLLMLSCPGVHVSGPHAAGPSCLRRPPDLPVFFSLLPIVSLTQFLDPTFPSLLPNHKL